MVNNLFWEIRKEVVRLKPEVLSVGSEVVVRSGPYEIHFKKGTGGKIIKGAVFFTSAGSYDGANIPDHLFKPAVRLANVVFQNHWKRAQRKTKEKNRKPLQLTLFS